MFPCEQHVINLKHFYLLVYTSVSRCLFTAFVILDFDYKVSLFLEGKNKLICLYKQEHT